MIEGVRYHLERVAPKARFIGGEPGDFGIDRKIPSSYGVDIERALIALVESESTRLVHEKVAARRKKGRIS